MKTKPPSSFVIGPSSFFLAATLCAFTLPTPAATNYVWQDSPSPTPPFTTWATAAHAIQDAVDSASAGDTVLVTNGVYSRGGWAVGTDLLVNRVAVDKPITLQSVNGPQVTVIEGTQAPGGGNGDGAVRCVYLTNGAVLSGFTLTNGATLIVYNYPYAESEGGGVWCESINAAVTNCVLTGNAAHQYGGGAYSGSLNNCILTDNSATGYYGGGGGASQSILNHCTLTDNSATGPYGEGGGAYLGNLNNCTLTGNLAYSGGGASYSTLNNCTLTDNSAFVGGGAYSGTLNNCTLTGNAAYWEGGGAYGWGAANNCIVYFNTCPASPNYDWSRTLNFCCTTPLPTNGVGNITADPQLASFSHLSAYSPCRAAGSSAYSTGTDIEGEAWASPPSIGCDEYWPGSNTGPLSVALTATYTNVATGFTVGLTPLIEGRTTASVWEFGDGVVVSNQPYTSHAWAAPGEYAVVLSAYNDTYPEGVSATQTVHAVAQPVCYVALDSANPTPPYSSWEIAATNIQDAVDEAPVTGLVLVSNGVYATGGRAVGANILANRVAVDRPITIQSVNGPEVTIIEGAQAPGGGNGDGAIRCVYLANGATLSGFTLTNGATRTYWDDSYREYRGGGLWCESTNVTVSNCTLTGNSASASGGGAYGGTLNKCTLTGNTAGGGGGAAEATLNKCVLTGNSATVGNGGGASGCTLNDCTLTGNSAGWGWGGGAWASTLNNCTLTGNSADTGGGTGRGTLNNCTLTGNSASSLLI